MRALVCNEYGTPDKLVVEEMDDPVPGEGQVLVSVKAAGINFGDVLTVAGKYQVKPPTPFVPGIEAAGVVAGLGPDTDQFSVGDSVMVTTSLGAFAEKCVVDQVTVTSVLPGLDFAQAAAFNITYCTTFHAFRQSTRLEAGETLLVLGAAGGVGIAAVEMGKAFGARVIAAASSDEKLEFAKTAGADELINYTETRLRDAIKALTDGNGIDVVYDPVGGELAELAMRSLAWRGRHLVVGFASGDFPQFPANIALLKEAQIVGVYWGGWARRERMTQAANLAEMNRMIETGQLSPEVTEKHSLENFGTAFDAITHRRAMGKVVLTMD
jgi:NADPH2:quinone reductase